MSLDQASVGAVEPLSADVPDLNVVLPTADSPSQIHRIRHDIQHEVATIMLLADVISGSDDVGPGSKARVDQLGREAQWLNQLLRAYDDATAHPAIEQWRPPAAAVRLDVLAGEVLAGLRLTTMAQVRLATVPSWTQANRLALWRALRNIMDNAFRAAGQSGQVDVRVAIEGDRVVAQVDDNGPGFGSGPRGFASLGLGIVQDFAVERGGAIEIRPSELGGSCVRLVLPGLSGTHEWESD
jgi:signal transduction histidine kinase